MDLRIEKLAEVLVHYSLELQPGEELAVKTSPLAEELNLAVYRQAMLAGGHVFFMYRLPGSLDLFYQHASDAQLDYISPVDRLIHENYRAILDIGAEFNTKELSGADPVKISRARKARSNLFNTMISRMGTGELKWTYTVFPTWANAQEAEMSFREYQDFVYAAGKLDRSDPVMAWREESASQQRLMTWLAGRDQVSMKGKDIDLSLSIKSRDFHGSSGKQNFPDGEIFTSPVEESVNGWVRFGYPAIYDGREVEDVELWFEDGKVVRENASKGNAFLTQVLNTDPGSRFLGEWGIGTNYSIPRFSKNMLFDEKLGGTIHLAVGAGFKQVGGKNESGVHWDMLCNMADSEIRIDGELFYQNGQFIVE